MGKKFNIFLYFIYRHTKKIQYSAIEKFKLMAKSKENTLLALIIMVSALLLAGAAAFAVAIKNVADENRLLLQRESALIKRVEKLRDELAYQSEYYEKLLHDDRFVQRLIKQKLGYTSQDEIIFRFNDDEKVDILPPPNDGAKK